MKLTAALTAFLVFAGLVAVAAPPDGGAGQPAAGSDRAPAAAAGTVKIENGVALLTPPDEEQDILNDRLHFNPKMVYTRREGGYTMQWRHDADGQRVAVEGVAMGEAASNSPIASWVLYEGGKVYIRGADYRAKELNGKTVRIVGTFRRGQSPTIRKTPDLSRKPHYYIEAESVQVIDAVKEMMLVTVSSDNSARR